MAMILAYWPIRGLAEPVRLLFEYVGAEYEELKWTDRDAWFKEKFDLGLPCPNLPYLIDGELHGVKHLMT